MDIKDYLSPEHVVIGKRFDVKRRLFAALCEYASCVSDLSKMQLLEKFLERERIGSTYLGHGCACPRIAIEKHKLGNKSHNKVFGFLTLLSEPVDYDPPHQQPVDIVFLLIGFDRAKAQQALELSNFRLNASWIRKELRQAKNAEEAYSIITGPIKPCLSHPTTDTLGPKETDLDADLDDMVPEFSTSLLS